MPDADTTLVWLRRDLRLTDNRALHDACERSRHVVLVYVYAPHEEHEWAPGAASRWWLHHSLAALARDIAARGGSLVVQRGDSLATLRAIAERTGARRVIWNRLYEPALVARDAAVEAALCSDGYDCETFDAALLFEPWQIRTTQGEPFRVFTPFWQACEKLFEQLPPPRPAPERIPSAAVRIENLPLDDLELSPRIRWDHGLSATWTPGEQGALARLEQFCALDLPAYDTGRNRPDQPATSRLSPHLHFGEIGPRQCVAATRGVQAERRAAQHAIDTFLRELGWREFAHHLLFHFPSTSHAPLDSRFASFPWSDDAHLLDAWQRGMTGYPIVDAGMRELWTTGWMHNRVRMIVASLLTKNLRQPWLEGARWFWDTLVDADLANNTLGWQWTAGCGADAAPYVRVFNPVLQAERFDPERAYLRRWIPELARLPDEWIHRPWQAPPEVLAAAGVVLGATYPAPIVDLRESRAAALAAYERIRRPR